MFSNEKSQKERSNKSAEKPNFTDNIKIIIDGYTDLKSLRIGDIGDQLDKREGGLGTFYNLRMDMKNEKTDEVIIECLDLGLFIFSILADDKGTPLLAALKYLALCKKYWVPYSIVKELPEDIINLAIIPTYSIIVQLGHFHYRVLNCMG